MSKPNIASLTLFAALPLMAMAAPVQAQSVLGSGVPVSTVENSAERPIGFADQAPAGAALIILMKSADLADVSGLSTTEAMAGANAQRPDDVVRNYGGKTIEILSTNAEGRLVLADAVQYAGLFARDDAVADRVLGAAEASGENLWQLPLHPAYAKAICSDIADVKNPDVTNVPGVSAGAHFTGYFVDETLRWTHLDMAGVNWNETANPLVLNGASGFGVRLLDQLARDWNAQ